MKNSAGSLDGVLGGMEGRAAARFEDGVYNRVVERSVGHERICVNDVGCPAFDQPVFLDGLENIFLLHSLCELGCVEEVGVKL